VANTKIRLWSGPPNTKKFKEGATQTFKEGDLVKLSAGLIVIATDGNDVCGVAAKKASGTTNADAFVYVITPEQVWSVFCTGTPATATHVGNGYDFAGFTAGNYATLSLATTTNKDAIVQGLDPRDTPASGTRVLVRFNYASADMIGG
jgi:methionine aminopeptidase